MQRMQVILHDKLISRVLRSEQRPQAPLPVRLLARFPLLRRIPGRIVGMGLRPEHVHSPEVGSSSAQCGREIERQMECQQQG
jgi:hypothetical protein